MQKKLIRTLICFGFLFFNNSHGFANEFVNAAGAGDESMVIEFIENGTDVNLKNDYGYTALMKAAYGGYTKTAALLLENGAAVNEKTIHGYTALMLASAPGHTGVVALLLENNADINATDDKGNTAFVYATRGQHQDVVNLLSNANEQAFLRVVSAGDIPKVQMFLDEGINVNALIDGISVLMEACTKGHTQLVALLLAKGADVHMADSLGQQALQLAASAGYVEAVELLVENAADINHQDLQNNTALMEAAANGQSDVVQYLVAQNANVALKNHEGKTAFMLAKEHNYTGIMRMLSEKKQEAATQDTVIFENINETHAENLLSSPSPVKQDNKAMKNESAAANVLGRDITISSKHATERSDIIVAAMEGNADLVERLLAQGVDVNVAEEIFSYTPLMAAASRGHMFIVELLLEHGADIHYQDKTGVSVLMSAAAQGHAPLVELLLERGVDANLREMHGKTALDFASENGHTNVVKLLRVVSESVVKSEADSEASKIIAKSNSLKIKTDESNSSKIITDESGAPKIIAVESNSSKIQTVSEAPKIITNSAPTKKPQAEEKVTTKPKKDGPDYGLYTTLVRAYAEQFGVMEREKSVYTANGETLYGTYGLVYTRLKDLNGDGTDELIIARTHKNPTKGEQGLNIGFDSEKRRSVQIFTLSKNGKLAFVSSLYPLVVEKDLPGQHFVDFAKVGDKEYIVSGIELQYYEKAFWSMQGEKLRLGMKFYYSPEADGQYKLNGKDVDKEHFAGEFKKWFTAMDHTPLNNFTEKDFNNLALRNAEAFARLNAYVPAQGDMHTAIFNGDRFVIIEDIPNSNAENAVVEYYRGLVTKDVKELAENEQDFKGIVVEELLTYTMPNIKKVSKRIAEAAEKDSEKYKLKEFRVVCGVNTLKASKRNPSGLEYLWFLVGADSSSSEWKVLSVYR